MRLYFILTGSRLPVPDPVVVEVSRILRRRGFEVDVGNCEEMIVRPDELGVTHDLYVFKPSELALGLASVLHLQGASLLNPYPSCIAAENKIVAARLLSGAGIPTPESWVTADVRLLHPLVEERPLIIKPYLGRRGAGIRVVRTAPLGFCRAPVFFARQPRGLVALCLFVRASIGGAHGLPRGGLEIGDGDLDTRRRPERVGGRRRHLAPSQGRLFFAAPLLF